MRRTSQRKGTSLVETLVILSAASTILTLSALLIHKTMQASGRAAAFHAEEATAWRLSAQLRADAIGVQRAEVGQDTLSLVASDGSVTNYDWSEPTVRRLYAPFDGPAVPTDFVFQSVGRWELRQSDSPRRVTVETMPPNEEGIGPSGAPLRFRVTIRLPEGGTS